MVAWHKQLVIAGFRRDAQHGRRFQKIYFDKLLLTPVRLLMFLTTMFAPQEALSGWLSTAATTSR